MIVIIREADLKTYPLTVGSRFTTTDEIVWDERTQGPVPADILATAQTNLADKVAATVTAANQALTPVRNALNRLRASATNSNDIRDILILLRYLNSRLDDL